MDKDRIAGAAKQARGALKEPAGTGLGALTRLQASARTSSIPVLVLSGSTDLTLPATVRAEGAKGFFRKPVDLDALCARLEELLSVTSPSQGASPAARG